jgi:hypothetical protein
MNNTWINGLINMKLFRFLLIPLILLCLLPLSCNQDSIFYDISNEPEPKDPLIPGSPTSMVLVRNRLYVGTRMGNRIFCFSGTTGSSGWSVIPLPSGSLGDLATDGNDLFVLFFPTGEPLKSSAVRRYNLSTGTWDMYYTLSGYSIQTLFGVDGKIFAGGQYYSNHMNFALFYLEPNSNSLNAIKHETSLLIGVAQNAEGAIYLATAGSGIFTFNEETLDTSPVPNIAETNLNGIINVGGSIVAVSANGNVYIDNGGGFSYVTIRVNFTGGMCVWLDRRNQWKPSLLLMGIRGEGTSLNHGYREMVLNNGKPTFNIRFPGDELPTSVTSKAKYEASIGTHPVLSILQLPDAADGGPLHYSNFAINSEWEPPIFASTSKNGLWSYKNGEWNAEE